VETSKYTKVSSSTSHLLKLRPLERPLRAVPGRTAWTSGGTDNAEKSPGSRDLSGRGFRRGISMYSGYTKGYNDIMGYVSTV